MYLLAGIRVMAAGPGRPAGEEEGESKGQSSCEDAGVTPSSRQQEPPPPLKEAPPPPTLAPAPESSVACTSCRRVKAFCDRLKPCSRSVSQSVPGFRLYCSTLQANAGAVRTHFHTPHRG